MAKDCKDVLPEIHQHDKLQTETRDMVDIWIIYKFLATHLIFVCFGVMMPKHIFPSKNVIKSTKL